MTTMRATCRAGRALALAFAPTALGCGAPLPESRTLRPARAHDGDHAEAAADRVRVAGWSQSVPPPLSLTKSASGIAFGARGEGHPVVLMHGSPTDHRSVFHVLEPAFERRSGFRRVYFDLPGVGESDASEELASPDRYVAHVVRFLEEQSLELGGRIAIVAQSWSAGPALQFLRLHPERVVGIALLVPSIRFDADAPAPVTLVDEPGAFLPVDALSRGVLSRLTTVHQPYVAERFLRDVDPGRRSANMQVVGPVIDAPLSYEHDLLEVQFDGPSLIVTGKQDAVCGFLDGARLAKGFPRATFAVLDRAGHFVAFEQQELWRALLDEWLRRVSEHWNEATHSRRRAPGPT